MLILIWQDLLSPSQITKHGLQFPSCFSTKAVHIELVPDLTKDSCITALKRFAAKRGLPEKIFSDNGTTFNGARNDIAKVQTLFS